MTTYAVPPSTRSTTRLATSPLTVAAVAGPVLFLIGQALLPQFSDTIAKAFPVMLEDRDRLMAARLFTAAGAFLLAFAAVYYCRLVPAGRGSQVMRTGAALFGVASFFNALSQAVSGYATWTVTAPGFDHGAARHVIEHVESGAVGLPLGFWSIPVFALGALVMAAGMWRSGAVPSWLPPLLVVGTVLGGALADQGPIVGLTQLPFTVAMVAMAVLVRNRDAD